MTNKYNSKHSVVGEAIKKSWHWQEQPSSTQPSKSNNLNQSSANPVDINEVMRDKLKLRHRMPYDIWLEEKKRQQEEESLQKQQEEIILAEKSLDKKDKTEAFEVWLWKKKKQIIQEKKQRQREEEEKKLLDEQERNRQDELLRIEKEKFTKLWNNELRDRRRKEKEKEKLREEEERLRSTHEMKKQNERKEAYASWLFRKKQEKKILDERKTLEQKELERKKQEEHRLKWKKKEIVLAYSSTCAS